MPENINDNVLKDKDELIILFFVSFSFSFRSFHIFQHNRLFLWQQLLCSFDITSQVDLLLIDQRCSTFH